MILGLFENISINLNKKFRSKKLNIRNNVTPARSEIWLKYHMQIV